MLVIKRVTVSYLPDDMITVIIRTVFCRTLCNGSNEVGDTLTWKSDS